jgi:hypothetical protein
MSGNVRFAGFYHPGRLFSVRYIKRVSFPAFQAQIFEEKIFSFKRGLAWSPETLPNLS